MGLKAPEVYQGGDWLTYRWSVAHAFDTLDRIRELCRMPLLAGTFPSMHSASIFRDDTKDEEMADLFAGIADLCDDLSGEFDAVLADLHTFHMNNAMQRWTGFEIRLHLNAIRQQALQEHKASEPLSATFDIIAARIGRMYQLLKQIDQ
jgi:hypothetical protein